MARLRMQIAVYVATLLLFVQFTGGYQYSLANPQKRLRTLFAAIGYSVDLDCQMDDPYVSVSLKQAEDERIVDGIKVTQSGQIFTINNVEDSDKGKYSCKVKGTSMRIEKLHPVKDGTGNHISSFSIFPTNTTAKEGGHVNFTCNVTGKGIATVEWYKKKKRIASTSHDLNDMHTSTLQLSPVTSSQAGPFECRATFGFGRYPLKGYKAKSGVLSVPGKCYCSISKSEKPHEMKMILEFSSSGSNMVFRRCSSKAGQGHCHHLSALAYAVLSSMEKSDDASACASKPQQWHVPRGAKIDPQPWMQLNFFKPWVGKESTRGASLCLYDPRSLRRKDSEESKQIFEEFQDKFKKVYLTESSKLSATFS